MCVCGGGGPDSYVIKKQLNDVRRHWKRNTKTNREWKGNEGSRRRPRQRPTPTVNIQMQTLRQTTLSTPLLRLLLLHVAPFRYRHLHPPPLPLHCLRPRFWHWICPL